MSRRRSVHQIAVFGQRRQSPLVQHDVHRIGMCRAIDAVADVEDLGHRAAESLFGRPARHLLGHRVEEDDAAVQVAGQHRVTDAAQDHTEPFALLAHFFLCKLAAVHFAPQRFDARVQFRELLCGFSVRPQPQPQQGGLPITAAQGRQQSVATGRRIDRLHGPQQQARGRGLCAAQALAQQRFNARRRRVQAVLQQRSFQPGAAAPQQGGGGRVGTDHGALRINEQLRVGLHVQQRPQGRGVWGRVHAS